MHSYLSPELLWTSHDVSTATSSADLQALSGGRPWNYLLLQTDDTTGFAVHIRFDATASADPTAGADYTATPGIVVFLVAGVPVPLVFERPWTGPATYFADAASKKLWITFGHVKTGEHQTQPIPGIGYNRAGG